MRGRTLNNAFVVIDEAQKAFERSLAALLDPASGDTLKPGEALVDAPNGVVISNVDGAIVRHKIVSPGA